MRFLLVTLAVLAALGALAISHHARRSRLAEPAAAISSPTGPGREHPAQASADGASGEPDQAAVERVIRAKYAEIERQGGVRISGSSTSRAAAIHLQLNSVKKTSCAPTNTYSQGAVLCEVEISHTIYPGGTGSPEQASDRVYMKRAADGTWRPICQALSSGHRQDDGSPYLAGCIS